MAPWIGAWLRKQRLKSGETLTEIAERLDRDLATMSRFERGGCSFSADDLPLILRAYRQTPRQLAERVKKEAA